MIPKRRWYRWLWSVQYHEPWKGNSCLLSQTIHSCCRLNWCTARRKIRIKTPFSSNTLMSLPRRYQTYVDAEDPIYSYFQKGCRKKICTRHSERQYGIWSVRCSWHCSCWNFYCCFPLAFANIRPWPLVPLKNKELKTTHNTFRGCRVHFFRQPFSKGLYKSWRHKLLKPNIDFLKLFYYDDINSQ